MGSAEGGVEIEQVAAEHPEAIIRRHADPLLGLLDFQARDLAFAMGLGAHLKAAVAIAKGLVTTMRRTTPTSSRSTPSRSSARRHRTARPSTASSASTPRSRSMTPRSPRHAGLEELRDPDEEAPADREAREAGLTFVKLDGTSAAWSTAPGSRWRRWTS